MSQDIRPGCESDKQYHTDYFNVSLFTVVKLLVFSVVELKIVKKNTLYFILWRKVGMSGLLGCLFSSTSC